MQELEQPQGEFHHFQLVSANGEIPLSVSVLVHYNQLPPSFETPEAITSDDIIALHEGLRSFDGDFIKAFSPK